MRSDDRSSSAVIAYAVVDDVNRQDNATPPSVETIAGGVGPTPRGINKIPDMDWSAPPAIRFTCGGIGGLSAATAI